MACTKCRTRCSGSNGVTQERQRLKRDPRRRKPLGTVCVGRLVTPRPVLSSRQKPIYFHLAAPVNRQWGTGRSGRAVLVTKATSCLFAHSDIHPASWIAECGTSSAGRERMRRKCRISLGAALAPHLQPPTGQPITSPIIRGNESSIPTPAIAISLEHTRTALTRCRLPRPIARNRRHSSTT